MLNGPMDEAQITFYLGIQRRNPIYIKQNNIFEVLEG